MGWSPGFQISKPIYSPIFAHFFRLNNLRAQSENQVGFHLNTLQHQRLYTYQVLQQIKNWGLYTYEILQLT